MGLPSQTFLPKFYQQLIYQFPFAKKTQQLSAQELSRIMAFQEIAFSSFTISFNCEKVERKELNKVFIMINKFTLTGVSQLVVLQS